MIILDTNVVSEAMAPAPNPHVISWLNEQDARSLFLTSISLAELRTGVARLPDGRRKATMHDVLNHTLGKLIDQRYLAFDHLAAETFATMAANAERQGRTIGFADGQIAAIALQSNFAVATRDTSPFETAGLDIINPWVAPG